jgi:peptidylprolyl isomerase
MRAVIIAVALVSTGCAMHRAERLPTNIPPLSGEPHVAFVEREIDITRGIGALAEPRKCFYVHYTGWLTNGKQFDSSHDTTAQGVPRTPLAFPQGARRVITGWDAGFEGMRVGGKRRLFIPYQLAYGEAGRPPLIPPKAELIFDVELMAVADTLPRSEAAPRGQPAPPPQCPSWQHVSERSAKS